MASAGFLVVAGLLAVATYNRILFAPISPGFVLADHVSAHLGFYVASDGLAWVFIPAVLADLIVYALLFYLIARLRNAIVRARNPGSR